MDGRRFATLYWLMTAALLAALVVVRAADPQPIAQFRAYIFDAYQKLSPRGFDASTPVRIVDIDSESLARVGQWPWPRSYLSALVEKLQGAGARVIAFDVILPEQDRLSPESILRAYPDVPSILALSSEIARLPSNDDRLAQAIAGAPVVMGFIASDDTSNSAGSSRAALAIAGDDPRQFVHSFAGAYTSLPRLAEKGRGLGAVNWTPGADQIVRRMPTLLSVRNELYPSLALEAIRLASNESTIFVRSTGGSGVKSFGLKTGVESVRIGSAVLKTDADGQVWLRFAPSDRRRYISAYTVLDGTFDRKEVNQRIILLGSSAPGLLDLRATPLESAVPGVEIHAQALEQILAGTLLLRPDYANGAEIAGVVVIGLLLVWLLYKSGPLAAAAIGASFVLASSALSWFAFDQHGILIDPVFPSMALALLYTAGTFVNFMRAEADRTRMRATFAHYMAPAVIEEVAQHPDRLKLGGETREVSLMFADIRGFTRLSEGMDAEQLTALLNRIFTPASEIIISERGTIDKFIGDAVMAFWGAPLQHDGHSEAACRAALRLVASIDLLNQRRQQEAQQKGQDWHPISIGVGLNSGPCCAGNLGSPQRFDYSVIGEPVNVASRLEGLTKDYGVPIIVGESITHAAPAFAFVELGSIRLRGKDRPERAFALIGDEALAASERFHAFSKLYRKLLVEHSQEARKSAADACRKLQWRRLDRLVDAQQRR